MKNETHNIIAPEAIPIADPLSHDAISDSPQALPADATAPSRVPDLGSEDDSLLALLSPMERDRLTLWLLTKKLDQVAAACAKPEPEGFGLNFSRDGLIAWEHFECRHSFLGRQHRAQEMCELTPSADSPRNIRDAAILHALELRLFELSVRPQSDVNEIKTLFLMRMESRNLQLAERKLQISLDQVAADLSQQAKILNPEQMQEYTRHLLGEFEDPNVRLPVTSNPMPLNPQSTPL